MSRNAESNLSVVATPALAPVETPAPPAAPGLAARAKKALAWWNGLDRRRAPERDLVPFRRLALQLHGDLPRGEAPRSALVVTPGPSELLVPAVSDLARCLGDELRRPVLLVDAGVDSAGTTAALGAAERAGFADRLADPKLAVERLALPTSHEGLSFLPAGRSRGPALPAPPEELAPLLAALEASWDFVLVAGGPLLRESMALALAPHVGCVLLLAVENETRLSDLDAARDLLALGRARRVALVLTR